MDTKCKVTDHPTKMLKEFHDVFGHVSRDVYGLREDLIREEYEEVVEAFDNLRREYEACSPLGIAIRKQELLKELCDLEYVVLGTSDALHYDHQRAFYEVHKSNMTKCSEDGVVEYREDGKILKPDTYTPADLRGCV